MFALPISKPRFKNIIFLSKLLQILVLFAKKRKIFERWGLRPQTPVPPAAGDFASKPPASEG